MNVAATIFSKGGAFAEMMKVGGGLGGRSPPRNFLKNTPFTLGINVPISLFYTKGVLERHEKEAILELLLYC